MKGHRLIEMTELAEEGPPGRTPERRRGERILCVLVRIWRAEKDRAGGGERGGERGGTQGEGGSGLSFRRRSWCVLRYGVVIVGGDERI